MYPAKNIAGASILFLLGVAVATAGSICPAGSGATPFAHNPDNAATGCNIVITVNSGGSLTVTNKDNVGYDNDIPTVSMLMGVVNNSGSTVSSLSLSGSGIFEFEGAGICVYTFVGSSYCTTAQIHGTDPQDYQGPTTTLSATTPSAGTVTFTGGLASGATTYFSLVGIANLVTVIGTANLVPNTTSVPTLGDAGLLLLAMSLAGGAVWKLRTSNSPR